MRDNSFKPNRKPFSIVLEKNNQVIFAKSFACENFNYRTINSVLPYSMLLDSISILEEMLKKKSIDYLWETTNLYREQDVTQMRENIEYYSARDGEILKLSFFQGRQLLASGNLDITQYYVPTREREFIDMTGEKSAGENIFLAMVNNFEYYMSLPTKEIIQIEDDYSIENKFPRIGEHYKEIIEKMNRERRLEMSYI